MGKVFTLEEETRNDFLVSKDRKALWSVMLDLFDQFDKICHDNNSNFPHVNHD